MGYEAQVRAGYLGNAVAQRAVRLVAEAVGSAPLDASDPALLALVTARGGGGRLAEVVAAQVLLHAAILYAPRLAAIFNVRPLSKADWLVVLGWSRLPMAAGGWSGGEVRGVIAPGPRLVASPPLAGLEANAMPDPADIPNNHFAYAVQWFVFAATALVIYGLALRKRRTP
jgi:hypothetical protein